MSAPSRPRLILASASPARLATLRRAGLDPEVEVSGLVEDERPGESAAETAERLALGKARMVADRVSDRPGVGDVTAGTTAGTTADEPIGTLVVLGCDSVLELDGQALGKPRTAPEAARRWRAMRGRWGTLHTGHAVVALPGRQVLHEVASTRVAFAEVTDAEVAAYVATGEPLEVAGAFTIDGLGGAFVERVDGDPHNVVGVSLPVVRRMLGELGIAWTALWSGSSPSATADADRGRPGVSAALRA